MFDKLIRELKALESTTVSIPLETDAEGYFDKECPSNTCLFSFKVHRDDWRDLVRDEQMFCPSCRHAAPAKSWYTTEQVERGRKQAVEHLQGRINDAMRDDARTWNSRQRSNGFLKITMKVSGGGVTPALVPIAAAEPMRLRTKCEICGCRYSYIGAAFFCPACGANSAAHTFSQTLAAVRTAIQTGQKLREVMQQDDAEVLARALLEKAFQDAVMCFQRLNEQLVESLPGTAAQPRRNLFQNLDEGSRFWQSAKGHSFEALIGTASLARLQLYFQRRHLLAHRQGIIDADYLSRSQDTSYVAGQRLVLREADAVEMVNIVEQLGSELIALAKA